MSHRWMKFWPGDWKGDAALRMCSLAARGLWIECIAVMHDAEPYGHLVVNGRAPTPRQIASIVGTTAKDAEALLAELEEAGVFSRTPEGTILSRRMVRDHAKSLEGREAIAKRWTNKGNGEDPTGGPNTPPNRVPSRDPCSLDTEAEAETEAEVDLPLASLAPSPRAAPRKREGLPAARIDDEFETWWISYPRKVGKIVARKAYEAALRRADWDPERLLTPMLLTRWDDSDGGKFIPHPSTWLNEGRWADGEQPSPPSASPELPLH